jgi:hypothetical protein
VVPWQISKAPIVFYVLHKNKTRRSIFIVPVNVVPLYLLRGWGEVEATPQGWQPYPAVRVVAPFCRDSDPRAESISLIIISGTCIKNKENYI